MFPEALSFFPEIVEDGQPQEDNSVLTAIMTNMNVSSEKRSGRIVFAERIQLLSTFLSEFGIDVVISVDSRRAFEEFIRNTHELRSEFYKKCFGSECT